MAAAGEDRPAELRIGRWLPPTTPASGRADDAAVTELIPAVRAGQSAQPRSPSPEPVLEITGEHLSAHPAGDDSRPRRVALIASASMAVAAAVPLTIGMIAHGSAPDREVQPPPALPPTVADPTAGILPTSVGAGPTESAQATRSASPGSGGLTPSGPLTLARPTSASRTSAPAGPAVNISIEAESPTTVRKGEASVRGMAGASGGAVVTSIGDGAENLVRFTAVTVPEAGTYTVAFHYVSDGRRRGRVTVNGGESTSVQFPGNADSDTVGSVSVRLSLKAGPNTIEFGNRISSAPDLDRIVVVR